MRQWLGSITLFSIAKLRVTVYNLARMKLLQNLNSQQTLGGSKSIITGVAEEIRQHILETMERVARQHRGLYRALSSCGGATAYAFDTHRSVVGTSAIPYANKILTGERPIADRAAVRPHHGFLRRDESE